MLEELERLGANAMAEDEVQPVDIQRWQKLFSLSYDDSRAALQCCRDDLGRPMVSDSLWFDVKASKELLGFNREAYEYDLFRRPKVKPAVSARTKSATNSLRGLILDGPLDTPEKVRDIAGLARVPTTTAAESEQASKSFCYITADEENSIRRGLVDRGIAFKPYFIRINIAAKDLSASGAPTLGIDTTLPQYRPNDATTMVQQQQYPVFYFFYGTLAQPEVLKSVLKLDQGPPALQSAYIKGSEIKTLGKYRALVDSGPECRVDGHAFMVVSEDDERELRLYETNMYEVVRCDIWLADKSAPVKGLTFRCAS